MPTESIYIPSSGGEGSQNLQQVTDIDPNTTNAIVVYNGIATTTVSDKSVIITDGVDTSSLGRGNISLIKGTNEIFTDNGQLRISTTNGDAYIDSSGVEFDSSTGDTYIGVFTNSDDTAPVLYSQSVSGFNTYVHMPEATALRDIYVPDENGTLLTDAQKGIINGVAELDSSGVVPSEQLPYTLLDYKGSWDANTNTPTLSNGGAFGTGDIYIVSVGTGTPVLGTTWAVGNMAIYNGATWDKIGAVVSATVTSVSSADNTRCTVANGSTTPVIDIVSAPRLSGTGFTINNVAFNGTANILLNQSTNTQTGTGSAAYTFVLTDNQKLVLANATSTATYKVPTDATANFPIGAQIDLIQMGVGAITIAPANSGTTLVNSKGGFLTTNGQWTGITLKKIATNNWVVMGNLI